MPEPGPSRLASTSTVVDGLAVYRRGPAGAPKVVLVHGAMDRAGGFVKLLRRLTHLDIVRYDRRGYGASRGSGLHRTITGHVDDLLSVIGDEPATVVGHSLGGLIALTAAARRPALIPSVAAFEAPLPWRESLSASSARRLTELAGGGEEEAGRAAERFLRRTLGDATWERLPESMRRDRRAEGPALVAEMVAARHEGELVVPALLPMPVLAGHGDRSEERHRVAAQATASEAPLGELWVIEGAAHPAHYTHAAEFARFVEHAVARSVASR
jgi:pimeloyl-ACP methyl ester carboxylesterase